MKMLHRHNTTIHLAKNVSKKKEEDQETTPRIKTQIFKKNKKGKNKKRVIFKKRKSLKVIHLLKITKNP